MIENEKQLRQMIEIAIAMGKECPYSLRDVDISGRVIE